MIPEMKESNHLSPRNCPKLLRQRVFRPQCWEMKLRQIPSWEGDGNSGRRRWLESSQRRAVDRSGGGRGERERAERSEEVSSQVLGSILVSMVVGDGCGLAAKSCLTDSCNLMDCSPLGILQARILEWVAISFSRGSSRPRNQTWVSCIARRLLHCTWILYWLSYEGSPLVRIMVDKTSKI